jgi:hypothetical protein
MQLHVSKSQRLPPFGDPHTPRHPPYTALLKTLGCSPVPKAFPLPFLTLHMPTDLSKSQIYEIRR